MSAEGHLPSPTSHESSTAHTTPPKDSTSPKISVEKDVATALEGTPSRVTINVRDSAPRAAPVAHIWQDARHHASCDSEKDELASSSEPESSRKPKSPSPHIVSPSSSPSRSPEIEVAEVEDINQEPGHTKWRSLGTAPDPAKVRDEAWACFPFLERGQRLWETADQIARHIQQRPIEDGALFRTLADWINLYLSATQPYASHWLDMYVDEHQFWSHFINVVNALSVRCREDREAFEELLASFAALTFRMIEIDCQQLQQIANDDSAKLELVSFEYLKWLCSVLFSNKSPMWRHLQLVYNYDPAGTISVILHTSGRPSFNGITNMSRIVRYLLDHARTIPDVIERTGIILDTVVRIVDHCHLLRHEPADAESDAPPSRHTLLSKAFGFFQSVDSILQTFISKQNAALSHDLCDTIVCQLSTLLQRIAAASESLTTRILKEELELVESYPTAAAPVIAEQAWRFHVLRKCFLEGRMEIRIQGVESMQAELVQIHRKFIQGYSSPQPHPVVPFLCDFIVNNRLIDYLVGVESHPRLIRLTGNIVGFLVVNQRYSEVESDKIWNTVIVSQDTGVVGAILQMLPSIFNISDYPQLLYLVTKLNDIPLAAWDTRMTTYAGSLLDFTLVKWKELRQGFGMDEPPYHCCFRLIREASGHESLTLNKRRAMSGFASQYLEHLLDYGPSDQSRLRLYKNCIGDIANRTVFATGSICVINILLRHDAKMDITKLAKEFQLADLVIAEFEQLTAQMSQGLHELRWFDEALAARFDLLQQIIVSSPESISAERGWALWETMVGSKAPSDVARDQALVMLVNTTMTLRKRNSFIDACISEFLPKLPPRYFTKNILVFVSQVSQYGNFVGQTDQHAENSPSDILGIDMLWRIALVAPPNTVERKAIETLVAAYVDSPKARGAPKAAIECMHVEVVERCVRQLTTAASQLKAFTDDTSNGEDQLMIMVASDVEIPVQRLSFSRSLLILGELFRRIRSHPSYSPVPSGPSQIHSDVEEINGVPVTIRYQPFNGGSNRPIKTLQVGDLERVRDLTQRFTSITGFSKFTVIVGGQKVNLEECNNATLRSTRLHEKGLFLLKNMQGSETTPDLASSRVLKPLETEVMGHFPVFYRFLSLDEDLAKDVLDFLKAFPPDNHVVSLVNSSSPPLEDVLPPATPYKTLYSVYTYEHCLKVSLQNEFKKAGQFKTLLRRTLLCDPRYAVRAGIARSIRSICDHPTLEPLRKHNFASYCWDSLDTIIPETLQYGQFAEEFCGVATTVFRSLDDSRRQDLDLTTYIRDWCSLLLKHHHDEFVGRDTLDWSAKKPVRISPMELLLRAHLFPQISKPQTSGLVRTAVPVLHSKTRDNLYSIVLALSNDVAEYHKLLRLVRGLLPQGEGPQAWSWGIAQTVEDYTYDANWNFDRSNAIRAPTGYPGLRNLTNTCYMNSFLTQLFMNVKFRGFLLGTEVADGNHTQRLLAESRALFAFMQETVLKTVDTQGIADSLINYENTVIDVSVQMDVDEFYNLLFDRWESQILSDAGKKSFRAFYGGQLVQQIKSKECPHISERLEPFSAIQCDIQGKTNLTESLAAYVGGEIMEGDNKYSCTSCGTYVDAVKRACLKDIPDNLIFHLKRFDYDIMTGQRHKINDRFDFPERIDMSPYNIDFLQDTDRPLAPDNFELVGILVHTGTAESGHYYSYIKERPTKPGQGPTWVEFNDADVTPFNPSQIPDFCFGGVTEPAGYAAASYSKSWNAYMLFYQRLRTMDAELPQLQPPAEAQPDKEIMSFELRGRIKTDNEKFLRKYCLYDSTHARFAVSLLDRLRNVTNSCCSEDHALEKDAILLALEYADQVLSRMKDSADFDRLLDSLIVIVRGCSTCCKLALEWIADNPTAFRSLLLRCPTAKVRKSFTEMLVRALRYLRENDPPEYGFDVDSVELKTSNEVLAETSCGILQRMIHSLREMWEYLPLHSRAWDDYFGVLAAIADFGVPEILVLLREGFLKLCLEVLIVESQGTKRLRALLLKIDFQARPFDPHYQDRLQLNSGQFPLSTVEETYLYYSPESGRSRPLVFLDKIITAHSNPGAVKRILQAMISAEPRAGHLGDISRTILNGVNIEPADLAEPHLDAALTFCETSPSPQSVRDMITQIAREVDTIGTSGGPAHLRFFNQALQLDNPRVPHRTFRKFVLRTVSAWAPPLLMYYEETVRVRTVDLLKHLIFHFSAQSADSGDENTPLEDYARDLCEACIKRVQENVIQQQSSVDVRSVEIIRDVIQHCVTKYFQTGTAEDDRVAEEAEAVCHTIQILAVEEADEANSGNWQSLTGWQTRN
ncbi:MAG: hypothetical protein Q9201_000937 [Fulgogasparrea decipioides]